MQISIIGGDTADKEPLVHMRPRAAQILYAATSQGLVAYDGAGEVIPGLARRWIVVDDGRSYIFRLRRTTWANGARVDARDVRRLLMAAIGKERARDPYGAIASISEVLAMTGDVIEIKLKSPHPDFLLALAQPAMGLALSKAGSGPYRAEKVDAVNGAIWLMPTDQEESGPENSDIMRVVHVERPARAMARFRLQEADLVLGGTLADLPYVLTDGDLEKYIRFDAVKGLFGLAISSGQPILRDVHVRKALSMGVDRQALAIQTAAERWAIAEQILPASLNLKTRPARAEGAELPMERRRDFARDVITRWIARHGGKPVTLTMALPSGPGMTILFNALQAQFQAIGITVSRTNGTADLTLIDEVAPYDNAAWYLGRLSCARHIICDEDAEKLLRRSVEVETMEERQQLLEQAAPLVQAHSAFIPLAMPVRWSLLSPRLKGFIGSPRGEHSLKGLRR